MTLYMPQILPRNTSGPTTATSSRAVQIVEAPLSPTVTVSASGLWRLRSPPLRSRYPAVWPTERTATATHYGSNSESGMAKASSRRPERLGQMTTARG